MKQINHTDYPKSLKSKTVAELCFIIRDANEAIIAMQNGEKANYYADEINYASDELNKRSK